MLSEVLQRVEVEWEVLSFRFNILLHPRVVQNFLRLQSVVRRGDHLPYQVLRFLRHALELRN